MSAQQIIAERKRIHREIAEWEAARPALPELPGFEIGYEGKRLAKVTVCNGLVGLHFCAVAAEKVLSGEDLARFRDWINECFPPESDEEATP